LSVSLEKLTNFLAERKATYVAKVRLNEIAGIASLEIYADKIAEKTAKGFTSKRQINNLRKAIQEEFGVETFVSIQSTREQQSLEIGLLGILQIKFRNDVQDVLVSFPTPNTAVVWISSTNTELDDAGIKDTTIAFLSDVGIRCETMTFILPTAAEATMPAILRGLKIVSPATPAVLKEHLANKGHNCSSEKWLVGKLDHARKNKLVVRNDNGSYALTHLGLLVVPYSRTKNSSDVERMLYLARRNKW
jgi:hypothetical protein